ncbi:MAG TPA: hypothetical protein VF997_02955 [Polyangia bacterium]
MSSFRRGAYTLLACGALLLIACNKKQDAAPAPPSGIPPLDQPAGAAPAPGDHPTHEATAGGGETALPPGHPQLPPGHPPMGGTAGGATMGGPAMGGAAPSGAFGGATPGGAFDPKTVLAGVIKLDGKIKDKVAPGDVVFVVARKYEEGATGPGTPLAVQKLTVDKFPLKFSLDSRDAMLAGTTLSGRVVVTARVDKDGDAITKNPGDVTGQTKPVEPPKKDLVLSLDTVL